MRILSFLPSATEIVYLLGLDDQLYGVTHECDYPEGALTKPKLTSNAISSGNATSKQIDDRVRGSLTAGKGIYSLDYQLFRAAKPDVIFTQELCEVCAVSYGEIYRAASSLPKKAEVISLDTFTVDDILAAIITVGSTCGKELEAKRLVESLNVRIKRVTDLVGNLQKKGKKSRRVLFVEWIDPLMSGGHWIPEMIKRAGGTDLFGIHGENSKRVNWIDAARSSPDLIVVAPCGFAVERARIEMKQLKKLPSWEGVPAVKNGNVFVADGNAYFSRPGPRIVEGLEILASMINPELEEFANKFSHLDYVKQD